MNIFEKYNLPSVLTGVTSPEMWDKKREEIKELLYTQYGKPFGKPSEVHFEQTLSQTCLASKAVKTEGNICFTYNGKAGKFPVKIVVPVNSERCKTVVLLNFNDEIPNPYYPAEELTDRGFAVVQAYYKSITTDDGDFSTGISSLLFDGERSDYSAGKIMVWAWAAGRIADYLETTSWADMSTLAVAGHSRLGKTALLAGALDERFRFVHSNNSGCSGAGLFRANILNEKSEHIDHITNIFSYWFCPSFKNFVGKEELLSFDQHFLLSLIAPRYVNVCSAEGDEWACPQAEYDCCKAASEIYEYLGFAGFVYSEDEVHAPMCLHDGRIGYHYRTGSHYFSRYDWNRFFDFIESKNDNQSI